MALYQNIILALDLHPECDLALLHKAQNLATLFGARLTVAHAVEKMYSYGIGQAYPGILDIEAELLSAAKEELAKLCTPAGIPVENQIVRSGSPKLVLFTLATEQKADLIIVGSHGRHGLGLLLGSTANSVLHNAACDVLAIRVESDA